VLAELQEVEPECFRGVVYTIIEPAARLRSRQQARLGAWVEKVSWCASLEALVSGVGIHFSNELFDALPVHRVAFRTSGWVERYVAAVGEELSLEDGPLSTPCLSARLEDLTVPVGYETEVNLAAEDLIGRLYANLSRGYVLAIDYGFSRAEYYRPERVSGTLSGYSGHRRTADLLGMPGQIDLTAHVDFTSLVAAAEAAGWSLRGYTDQHHLMVGLSPLYFADENVLTREQEQELRAFKTLMHPDFMGRSFKALCLEKGISGSPPLAGFRFARDSRGALGL
jgi:SAM-dependent MidA family methyltransferase